MPNATTPVTPPPLPEEMRVRFRDYPEHIAELERALARFQPNEYESIDPFERVLWVLESTLDGFISHAREMCRQAEATGDAEAIARANSELLYMLHSRNPLNYDLARLRAYLDARRDAFS
jgi:hypothetical protein